MQARQDAVSERDQEQFARLDIESRFGVRFNPHVAVCTDAADGETHCNARVIADAGLTPRASSKIIAGYGPAQLRSAYGVNGIAGSKKIIAIVDAYNHPNIQSDLDTYSTTFGIPKLPACAGAIANSAVPCFKKVDQRGGTRYPRTNAGWALEIALDVEVAHAMCQNCSILLVEADSSSYSNMMTAVDRAVALGANVVSNSYGSNEFSGETSYDHHFNRPGVAFTVSSGDSGYGAEYPASSRYVTSVGGTSLFLNSDGSYNSELTWSGAGSGCSAFEAKQSWQTDTGCARRTNADVSAVADPNTGAAVYDSVNYFGQSGWWQVGGTSLSSPIIAAVYALSGNTSGNANQIPYTLGNSSNLHDIVSGSNGSCGGSYLCTATAGFDGPTGLGSPKGVGAF
ncbi:S53 family peptidase [Candidatus Kaiserbacteria bacterium]|nr:S53 family peptidase [Candidatus Kaiserbacteria bacterium]